MRVLFVCKHNRFRSKVAEAFFNKFNKDKKVVVKCGSRGILLDSKRYYIEDIVKKIVREKGLEVDDMPRQLFLQDLDNVDLIISLGADVEEGFFCERAKVEIWDIEHVLANQEDKIRKITDNIEARIKDLVGRINV